MKKLSKIFTVSFLLCIVAVFTSACSNQSPVNVKEGKFSVPVSDLKEINISVKDRAIEIVPSTDDEIHISYYENEKEFYQIGTDENGRLLMKLDNNKDILDYVGLNKANMRSIKLEVPESLDCDLIISTTNNDLVLPEMRVNGNINIDVNNGNIVLTKVYAQGDIALKAKNGSISGTLMGSYDEFEIKSEAHKGDNNLPEVKENGSKLLNVTTNNGNIDIKFEK